MRIPFVWAVVVPALLGCVALVLSLPWGDPCGLATRLGADDCVAFLSPSQQNLRNVVFVALCFLVGCATGFVSSTRQQLAGALSSPLAVLLAVVGAHSVYGFPGPLVHFDAPGAYRMTLLAVTGLVIVGIGGGTLSRYIRPTIGGARER